MKFPFKPNAPAQASAGFPHVVQQAAATAPVRHMAGVVTDMGSGLVTSRAEAIRHQTDEEMIWREKPSLLILAPQALFYGLILACLLALNSWMAAQAEQREAALSPPASDHVAVAPHPMKKALKAAARKAPHPAEGPSGQDLHSQAQLLSWLTWGIAALLGGRLLIRFVRLKVTTYSASSQRLFVESGILRNVNRPHELHLLGDATIVKPLLMRPFGIAHMAIGFNGLQLLGLRNAAYVRDILRNSGQLEAQRVDKIRWR